ncbi:hypothetical protein GCM10009691_13490 [Brevibacterium picturae]|uniref:Uncharacterized protein n=1 Tax=Brevibacterium picturae TaxID=260553 RepID=A0ABN2BIC5_9MICO
MPGFVVAVFRGSGLVGLDIASGAIGVDVSGVDGEFAPHPVRPGSASVAQRTGTRTL